jgi:preprotein translocase SecE subunit
LAEDRPSSKPKRQVKNPETFREKSLKSATNKDKPKRSSKVFGAPKKALKALFRPLVRLVRKLKKIKALSPLFWVLTLIGRILVPKYIRGSFSELKQVNWPSTRQSIKLTYAVLAFAIVFGASVATLDYGLDKVFKNILLK